MQTAKRTGERKAAGAALLLFCLLAAFLCLFLFLGSAAENALPGVPMAEDPAEKYELLLLEEQDGRAWAVCGGEGSTLVLLLDASSGGTLLKQELFFSAGWAALRGDRLFLREDVSETCFLFSLNLESLEEVSRRELNVPPGDLVFFDCDPAGTAYFVLSGSREVLRALPTAGEETSLACPGPVEFLAVSPEGRLCYYARGMLYLSEERGLREFPCFSPPLKALGDDLLMDGDGVVLDFAKDGEPLFRSPFPLYGPLTYCLDRENCLILPGVGGTVCRYDLSGEPAGTCALESPPLAVCAAGGVVRSKGSLLYCPFQWDFGSSPSPEPSALSAVSSSPEPEEPPLQLEGEFLILPAGTSADSLRELFKPDVAEIFDTSGRPVVHGGLRTGMTAGEWAVVIEGDCDGTGTVTQADLRAALRMSLGPAAEDDPYFRAADLNGDGAVDTHDLLLFSELLSAG